MAAARAHWELDTDAAACRDCGQAFTFLLRRHHCRSCGLIFCAACSPLRTGDVRLAGSRACSACWDKAVSDAAFEASRAAAERAEKRRARAGESSDGGGGGGGGSARASAAQSPLKFSLAANAAAELLSASGATAKAGESGVSKSGRQPESARGAKERGGAGANRSTRAAVDAKKMGSGFGEIAGGAGGGRRGDSVAARLSPAAVKRDEAAGLSATPSTAAAEKEEGRVSPTSTQTVASLSLRRTAIALLRLAEGVASDARPHERAVTVFPLLTSLVRNALAPGALAPDFNAMVASLIARAKGHAANAGVARRELSVARAENEALRSSLRSLLRRQRDEASRGSNPRNVAAIDDEVSDSDASEGDEFSLSVWGAPRVAAAAATQVPPPSTAARIGSAAVPGRVSPTPMQSTCHACCEDVTVQFDDGPTGIEFASVLHWASFRPLGSSPPWSSTRATVPGPATTPASPFALPTLNMRSIARGARESASQGALWTGSGGVSPSLALISAAPSTRDAEELAVRGSEPLSLDPYVNAAGAGFFVRGGGVSGAARTRLRESMSPLEARVHMDRAGSTLFGGVASSADAPAASAADVPFALSIQHIVSLPNGAPSPAQSFNARVASAPGAPPCACALLRPSLVLVAVNGASLAHVSAARALDIVLRSPRPATFVFRDVPLVSLRARVARAAAREGALAATVSTLASALSATVQSAATRSANDHRRLCVLATALVAERAASQSARADAAAASARCAVSESRLSELEEELSLLKIGATASVGGGNSARRFVLGGDASGHEAESLFV